MRQPDDGQAISAGAATRRALMARAIRQQARAADRPIPRRPLGAVAPLAFTQQRLWMVDQIYPGNLAYNVSCVTRLDGPLRHDLVERSLSALIERHEVLRTTFVSTDGMPHQRVAPPAPFKLSIVDLGSLPAAERGAALDRLGEQEARSAFDLCTGPLVRALLVRMGDDEHHLFLTLHHAVADGWSVGVINRELAAHYAAFAAGGAGEAPGVPTLPVQFADYAAWQRAQLKGEALDAHLRFWREELAGAPFVLDVPADRPRPAVQSFRGASVPVTVPGQLAGRLRELGRGERSTLFMTLLAAFEILLARYTARTDLLVASPIANRTRVELEDLVGFFANTLVLRGDLAGNPTFRTVLQRTRDACLRAYAHQDLPFERLVEELRPERDLSRNPLVQVCFALQNAPAAPAEAASLTFALQETENGTAPFDLMLELAETDAGLRGRILYSTDLFDRDSVLRMAAHFVTLLGEITAAPDGPIAHLPLLTASERRQILVEWNATATSYPREASIPDLFAAQVARAPDAAALVWGDAVMTYRDVEERANQLAHRLRALGAGPEVLVGVCLERSFDLVVAILAILKAGAAYLPLDPSYPAARLAYLLHDARAPMVITSARHLPALAQATSDIVCLDRDREAIEAEPRTPPPGRVPAEALAYVMYTSGSTGNPKGVCTPHRAVVRLVARPNYVSLSDADTLLMFAPLAFDASTFEIWGTLLNGARLVVFPPGLPSLEALAGAIERHGVTTLWLTAGLFQQLVDHHLPSLGGVRQLLAGGDVLSVVHVRRLLEEVPACRMINGYGPTETTTFACCHHATAASVAGAQVPIGQPISDTRVYILDDALEPVPVGVPGKLYIAGDGLARGYLGRPALTAERFIPDPVAAAPGDRMYDSGDLARFRPDGTIEFLGRRDTQVKLRGFRIELGEVESILDELPAVRSAVVTLRVDAGGNAHLVGYVVLRQGAELLPADARAYLRERLPEYMVPSAFVTLDALPLTANGKIDRAALPPPPLPGDTPVGEDAPPATETQAILTAICSQLLGGRPVRPADNFFEIGGHSLLATQVVSRARAAFGVEMEVAAIFETQSLAELAELIDWMVAARDPEELARMLAELDRLSESEEAAQSPGLHREPGDA